MPDRPGAAASALADAADRVKLASALKVEKIEFPANCNRIGYGLENGLAELREGIVSSEDSCRLAREVRGSVGCGI